MGIILHNEQLKFGKYKGHTLSQVCQIDSAYVNWLIENINENSKYEINNLKDNLDAKLEDANYEFNDNLQRLKDFFNDQIKSKKIADLIEDDLLRYSREVDMQIKNFSI